ncbi:6461_t:CDS:2 [Acaulospora morrowiae]|uniref:6461_t:CDS:1 n=1 Tax=Acaulospora morrowiae TaxID=94023 RepID=A0A9N8VBI9_9GLOM|nr:6461_t:CDS:2 [Acaulospora morrowiae]
MQQNNPFYGIDMETLVTLANLLQIPEEQKRPEVRFAEIMNIREYIDKSCFGNVLPYNKQTHRMLNLEDKKLEWSSLTDTKDIDNLIQTLDNSTENNTTGMTSGESQNYPVGVVIQLVTRLLAYSIQYRKCLSTVPTKRLTCALYAISDYRNAMIDLSNPFTTLQWNTLIFDFLGKTQNLLKLPFNPYSNPTEDAKSMITGISPFLVTGGAINPLDVNVSFVENLYRQTAGQYGTFEKTAHVASYMWKFGFKEYVTHKIPMKRVINGAYTCYVDPLNKTYYYTTLVLDPFCIKVLKNLLIYEIISGKAAYIHSALYFIMSMCTCEEDFQLMIDYGVIEWGFPMEGYDGFCEKMKELLDVMYCWKISTTYTWHLEMVQIVKYKRKMNNTSNFNEFAASCYVGGLLKKDLAATLYSSLS